MKSVVSAVRGSQSTLSSSSFTDAFLTHLGFQLLNCHISNPVLSDVDLLVQTQIGATAVRTLM